MDNFDKHFAEHDRQMKIMGRVFWVFFTFVLVAIIAVWCFGGYVAYMMATNPESLGKFFGEIVKGFNGVL